MNTDIIYITKKGITRLEKELEDLRKSKRKEIAERIHEAKELGDLSENAEYTDAKNEQAFVEGRIIEIMHTLKHATIIEENTKRDVISVGSKIRIQNNDKKHLEFIIVGSNEADPEKGYISNESPLGKAFVGRQMGEKVEIKVPRGKMSYVIIEIL